MREGKRSSLICYSFLSGIILATSGALAPGQVTVKASATDGAKSAESYGKLPLAFEANQGQADPSVKFLSRGSGYSLFLTGSEAVLTLGRPDCKAIAEGQRSKPVACVPAQDSVRMKLTGAMARRAATATGEAELPSKVNYFIGNDPTRWHSDLPTYAKVRSRQVYPGVDLVYYGNQRQLEYDFVVAPGADAKAIQLQFSGAKKLALNADGDLTVSATNGAIAFHKPSIYQLKNGHRQPVEGQFSLPAKNLVGFRLGKYDHSQPLVIDPVLVYSTYLGGTGLNGGGDVGNGIAVDSNGSAYVIGTAYSSDFPTTDGAFQGVNKVAIIGRGSTVFVSKFNAAGTALEYSTYLGGTGSGGASQFRTGGDFGSAIAIDSSKNVYLTGMTYSADFPVSGGAYQAVNNQAPNSNATAFVTKLNASGNVLLYSTYLGGSAPANFRPLVDAGQAITIDASGNAYVTGLTFSSNFPVTGGAFQTHYPINQDGGSSAFVTKLNSAGTSLVYSTYLGGKGCTVSCIYAEGDQGDAIAVDASGNAYIGGGTFSSDFPVTAGALQTVNHGAVTGGQSGFVTKLNPAGATEVYSTFLGGSGLANTVNVLAIDNADSAYVAGATNSTDFPTTAGVVGPSSDGQGTGFVARLNAAGSALNYSTFLGGDMASATGLAVDSAGTAYVTGNALPANFSGSADAVSQVGGVFVVKLDATATGIEYATLLGGTGGDSATALALDATGRVYITGGTASSNFTISSGAFQTINHGTEFATGDFPVTNAFVSVLDLSQENADRLPTTTVVSTSSPTTQPGRTVTLTAAVAGGGDIPTGEVTFTGQYCSKYTITSLVGASPWSNCTSISSMSASLDASGGATVTTPALKDGLYTFYASYAGDLTHLQSNTLTASNPLQVQAIGPPAKIFGVSGFVVPDGSQFNTAVNVRDAVGFPLTGITVNFSGTGLSFAPAAVTTDPNGYAVANITALKAGNLTAIASIHGLATTFHIAIDATPAPLTVTMHSASRYYGTANPTFTYSVTGLIGSDTVTVVPSTTATTASPVGYYPITATVTGTDAANYTVTVINSVLHVRPAPLHIVASNVSITYGQTPAQPTAYVLTGFVNGDTKSVVSGAPVLSTSVTSTTPVGIYKIGIQTGTLTAANYEFTGVSNGEGSIYVKKAHLALTAANQTMTQGGAVPALTYTLSGFVNGQNAAGTVSGTPFLSTTATSASRPGHYFITATPGSLTATNYVFEPVKGIMTVLP